MPRLSLALASALLLTGGAAFAGCQEELASLEAGVAKDGTTAPLDSPATPQTGGEAATKTTGEGLAKDGATAPLATSPDVATSGQDAQAQQQGGATAAQQAVGGAVPAASPKSQAIARAHDALKAGDEEACMKAVEEAKSAS